MRIRNSSLGAAVVFLAVAKVIAQDTRPPANHAVERELHDLARRDRAAFVEPDHAFAMTCEG